MVRRRITNALALGFVGVIVWYAIGLFVGIANDPLWLQRYAPYNAPLGMILAVAGMITGACVRVR